MSFTNDRWVSQLKGKKSNGFQPDKGDKNGQENAQSEIQAIILEGSEAWGKNGSSSDVPDSEVGRSAATMNQDNPALFAIYLVGLQLQKFQSPTVLAQEVIRIMETNLGYDKGAVLLVDRDTKKLKPFALSLPAYGENFNEAYKNYLQTHDLSLGSGISGRVVQSGQTICVGDLLGDLKDPSPAGGIDSTLCVPIRVGGVVIGVIKVESYRRNAYSDPDRQILETISGQLAIAFQNAHLVALTRQRSSDRPSTQEDTTLIRNELNLAASTDVGERYRAIVHELRAQNEELNAFNHTVAHDLKNPLSILLGFSEVLVQDYGDGQDEVLDQAVRVILENGRRMENIISELLLLAEVRQLDEIEIELLDMTSIVVETRKRLSNLIGDYGASIRSPASWPGALGHRPWVEEIWVNYLSNAIKYGGSPPEVELGANEMSDGMVRFWVRDNGRGISSNDQARLFVPFTKLQQVNTKGHGLGLSIVQRITTKLGGHVGVESDVGQGSLFWFTLPKANREQP